MFGQAQLDPDRAGQLRVGSNAGVPPLGPAVHSGDRALPLSPPPEVDGVGALGAGAAAGPLGICCQHAPRDPGPRRPGGGGGLSDRLLGSLLCPGQLGQELWQASSLPPALQAIQWSACPLLCLGVYLSTTHPSLPENWQDLEARVGGRLRRWTGLLRYLSLRGRMLVLNQLVLSMLWHWLNTLTLAPGILARLQRTSIGCDDYLGSDKVADKCGICGGDNTGCKVVSGVFKHTLTNLGYHKIVEIPEGAIKINITEMSKSNNYLALRSRSGRSIINGNWAIDRPGRYEGGGTTFTYKRPNEISSTAGESFLADGPTDEILDVYMIHQQPNPGILYEYIIPEANVISPQLPPHRRPGEPFNGQLELTDGTDHEDENLQRETDTHTGQSTGTFPVIQPGRFPSHQPDNQVPAVQPPRRNREHNWKQVGTTECTTSCGKGLRYPIFHCVNRISHEEVSESYCDTSTKPTPEEEACNIFPCPAFWDIGEWSECSKTCGLGMQHRQVLCRQVYANRTLMVQQYRCHHLEKPETTSTCQLKICSEWQIQTEWTSCSVPCGVGQRTRDVKCVSNLGDIVDDEECNMKLRPNDIENCDMGPCAKSWFLTEWSDRCSAECGAGFRTRSVVCMTNHVSSLPLEGCGNNRPSETIPCDNGPCVGKVEWFAGSWSQCSIECSSGTQQREVICIRKTEGSFDVLNPYECSFLERPPSQQPCYLKPCGAKWFNTEWSTCSKSCEGGFRVREVRCLSDDLTPSNQCDPQLKPEEKEPCNTQDCIPEIDENCKDKYYNCNVVVQARLCVYTYYKTACCASCTKVANRQSGFLGRR
uniref:PLAC domain-containing protein n=1 Tax=Gopherus agassizii TaxID=38772 RepID=A0A452IXB7_9SAUR